MSIRYLKVVLVGAVALLCLAYASHNIVNLPQALEAVAYTIGQQDHQVYPRSFVPALTHPALVWVALGVILAGEFAAGLVAAKGAWDLWRHRQAPAVAFNGAKTWAVLGPGLGVVVWFGLFGAIGGAVFQQWQTQAGALSLEGAFQYAGMCALVMLFVSLDDR
jgi:predicted small integral membrane protein